jgi:hypothetical protein
MRRRKKKRRRRRKDNVNWVVDFIILIHPVGTLVFHSGLVQMLL